MEKKAIQVCMVILLFAGALFLSREGARIQGLQTTTEPKEVIVIDPGHGGSDPGKIGINNAKEKDLNLSMAKKLKALLENDGYTVVMTRETDEGLYDQGTKNKKAEDMQRRCGLISQVSPIFTVSIHQNSYQQEAVHGPQVFYYSDSAEGKVLAECIQNQLNGMPGLDKPREVKANNSYYMLKRSKSLTVIVECGFLSNSAEAAKLINEEYQDQVMEAVHKGLTEYRNKTT